MSSINVLRTGAAGYQSTMWDDGVLRYDGAPGDRLGAWQSRISPNWFAQLETLVLALPKATRSNVVPEWTVMHDLGRTTRTSRIASNLEETSAWQFVTSFHGVLATAQWAPVDETGRYELSGFTAGTPVELRQARVLAEGLATTQGIVVLAGAVASTTTSASLEPTYKAQRESLYAEGALLLWGDQYVLSRHLYFDKPSAAASVLAGSNTNGRAKWTNKSGVAWTSLGLD